MEFKQVLITVGATVAVVLTVLMVYFWYVLSRFRRQINDLLKQVVEEAEANMVGLDIELDQGTYFCYNSEDKQFICQGATVGEIAQAFKARFPTKTAYLAGGAPEVVEQFKQELLKLAQNETSTSQ